MHNFFGIKVSYLDVLAIQLTEYTIHGIFDATTLSGALFIVFPFDTFFWDNSYRFDL